MICVDICGTWPLIKPCSFIYSATNMSQALRAKNIVLGTGITEDRYHVALHPEEPGTGAGTRAKDAYGEE